MTERHLSTVEPYIRDSELERISIGVVLLIIGLDPGKNGDNAKDPLIWTLTELESKVGTDKRAGQLSVPAETRKTGEDRTSTILGALAEFCDDANIEYLQDHLIAIDEVYIENGITVKGNPADVAVLIYDGLLDIPFKPFSRTEVSGNGWMQRSEIQAMDTNKVRSILDLAIKTDHLEGLTARALEFYYNNPGERKKIIPVGFLMQNFYKEREIIADIPIITHPQA